MSWRTSTLRALTYSITMMEKHDVMTIRSDGYFLTMLKEARDLIRDVPVNAERKNKYWAICEDCGKEFRLFMMPAKKAKYCPNCGRRLKYDGQMDSD